MNALICKKSVLVLSLSTVLCCMVLVIKISFDFCWFLYIKVRIDIEISCVWPQCESRSKQKNIFDEGKDLEETGANAISVSAEWVASTYLYLTGISHHELLAISWRWVCRLILRGLRKDSLVSVDCRAVIYPGKCCRSSQKESWKITKLELVSNITFRESVDHLILFAFCLLSLCILSSYRCFTYSNFYQHY